MPGDKTIMLKTTRGAGPHADQPIVSAGQLLDQASTVLILVHGRGGAAADMIGLAKLIAGPDTCCLAPQAASHTWYPYRFTEPTLRNAPYLDSALSVLGSIVDQVIKTGIPANRIALLGFSQGACLSLEFALRRRSRLGAVIGLSGGLIGDTIEAPSSENIFESMPVVLACSEQDPHIPILRVHETEAVLRSAGAKVMIQLYPGSGHNVNEDEIVLCRKVMAEL